MSLRQNFALLGLAALPFQGVQGTDHGTDHHHVHGIKDTIVTDDEADMILNLSGGRILRIDLDLLINGQVTVGFISSLRPVQCQHMAGIPYDSTNPEHLQKARRDVANHGGPSMEMLAKIEDAAVKAWQARAKSEAAQAPAPERN